MHSLPTSLPPIECLTAALEAMRSGSFSAAAATLGVSHAAVSRRVAGAEAWAGGRLFDRHGRGVRPTPEGQRLLTRIQQHFNEIDALVDRSRQPRVRETVRLAVTPSFARYWLLPRLQRLEGKDLRIEVLASQQHTAIGGGEVDLAIRYGRGGWGKGVETALLDEWLVPMVRMGAFRSAQVTGDQVLTLPLLHDGDTFLWRSWARQRGFRFRAKSGDRVFADYGLAVEAARVGLGVALWNRGLHDLPPDMVAVEDSALTDPPLRHYLLQAPGRASGPAARLAIRLLSDQGASSDVPPSGPAMAASRSE